MLTRAQFLDLTDLNSDGLMALKRRDQIPFLDDTSGYTLFGAFTYILADRLASKPDGHAMDRTVACSIIRDAGREIAILGDAIEESGPTYRIEPDSPNILVGRIRTGYTPGEPGIVPFCGDLEDLIDRNLDTVDVMLTSATAAMAVLQARALGNDLTTEGMWPAPISIPSFEERHEKSIAGLRAAVDQINRRYAKP